MPEPPPAQQHCHRHSPAKSAIACEPSRNHLPPPARILDTLRRNQDLRAEPVTGVASFRGSPAALSCAMPMQAVGIAHALARRLAISFSIPRHTRFKHGAARDDLADRPSLDGVAPASRDDGPPSPARSSDVFSCSQVVVLPHPPRRRPSSQKAREIARELVFGRVRKACRVDPSCRCRGAFSG